MKLKTDYPDRQTMIDYLREQFPAAVARSPEVAPMRGARRAAEALLRQIDPVRYASTRNRMNGAVTRLSAYLRHGIISLAEVRHLALQRSGARAEKLVTELGWRDYWQRVYRRSGAGIWQDRESGKTGWAPRDYAAALPPEIPEGRSGLACMDHFARELRETGYIHNHARMWIAAWVVHFRRIRWQAGAAWFLEHLLDGDPASNNLSWQWVAGTFSTKPYYFNRENLERFTDGVHCRSCRLARSGCPFEGTYEDLHVRLFPRVPLPEGGRR
ncbi:MAG: FAD-binding domain-containing protein [Blastocatellia bacterium]